MRRAEQLSSMCACAWRSKSAAIFRRTARSRCCVSAIAGTWRSIRVSSATPKATWWSSTSIPGFIEQFGTEASKVIRTHMEQGHQFALVSRADARALRAHGHGAPVPDVACAARTSRSRVAQVKSWVTSRDTDQRRNGFSDLPSVLSYRRLHHADARVRKPLACRSTCAFLAVSVTLALAPVLVPCLRGGSPRRRPPS